MESVTVPYNNGHWFDGWEHDHHSSNDSLIDTLSKWLLNVDSSLGIQELYSSRSTPTPPLGGLTLPSMTSVRPKIDMTDYKHKRPTFKKKTYKKSYRQLLKNEWQRWLNKL
jgi:hypothetical protein